MAAKIMTLANDTLKALLVSDYSLKSITIQEANHFIYVRPINEKYHVVVITNTEETAGLREMNIKELISRLNSILANY
jgi:predicted regulator of Ras-like GTPase activity (Roadblock/LC7/MglB family)